MYVFVRFYGNSSPLWKYFEKLKLTQNMRVQSLLANGQDASEAQAFCKWLLDIGEGRLAHKTDPIDNSTDNIEIDPDGAVQVDERGLIDLVYPSIKLNTENISDRAILATTNSTCDSFNSLITDLLPGLFQTESRF
jgi:hypothetical protein